MPTCMGLGSSGNGLNGLIGNWCTRGSWFTPAPKLGLCETGDEHRPSHGLGATREEIAKITLRPLQRRRHLTLLARFLNFTRFLASFIYAHFKAPRRGRGGAVIIDLGLSLGFSWGRLLFPVTVRSSWGLNVPHNALKARPFSYTKLHLPTLLGTYTGLST